MKFKDWFKLDNIVLGLLFLFPIAGTFVRHWISDIYVLLFLVSIYFIFRREKQDLAKEEVIWLWILVAYFLVFVITSLVNGWTERQTEWVLLELRFIGIIPVYLMLRRYPEAGYVLLYGIAIGLIANIFWGTYEIFFQIKDTSVNYHEGRLTGVYSPLFIGPVVLLMCALLVPGTLLINKFRKNWKWIGLAIILGIYLMVKSEARSAYLALLVFSILIPLYYHQRKKVLIIIIPIGLVLIGAYSISSTLQQRTNITAQQIINYLTSEDKVNTNIESSSVGIRLEMWRATQYVLEDSPLLGVGRGNYSHVMNKYVKEGLVNPTLSDRAHPHNAYIESFISRGFFGLAVMLLLLYYPLYVFVRTRQNSPNTALLGIIHILAISIFSLTESAAFIKGNFVAINLLFLAVFFAWHLRKIDSLQEKRGLLNT